MNSRFLWLFGEFRGTGRSFLGRWRRRLPGWTHVPRTMPGCSASTTSDAVRSVRSIFASDFCCWECASPAAQRVRPMNFASSRATRCRSPRAWSPGRHGAAAWTTRKVDKVHGSNLPSEASGQCPYLSTDATNERLDGVIQALKTTARGLPAATNPGDHLLPRGLQPPVGAGRDSRAERTGPTPLGK